MSSDQVEIERLRFEAEQLRAKTAAEAQQRRIGFWTMIFTTVMGTLVSPLLLYILHGQTVSKVEEVKTEAVEAKNQATTAVHRADTAAKLSKTAAINTQSLSEKSDANLKQWKAFNSREPDDMEEAAVALAKVERESPSQVIQRNIEAKKE